jgi:hypothetical protein
MTQFTFTNFLRSGAATKSRTRDPLITSQMLYQLSYSGFNKSKIYFLFQFLISKERNFDQNYGAATKSRTRDPLITSQMLYQLSYSGISQILVGTAGFEPATTSTPC